MLKEAKVGDMIMAQYPYGHSAFMEVTAVNAGGIHCDGGESIFAIDGSPIKDDSGECELAQICDEDTAKKVRAERTEAKAEGRSPLL